MISPKESQAVGLIVSLAVGLFVGAAVKVFLSYELDFQFINEVVAPLTGLFIGIVAAFSMFTLCRCTVPINKIGIGEFLGSLTDLIFDYGTHWIPPGMKLSLFWGKKQNFPLEIIGDRIEAKDGASVYFGVPENGGKKNNLQYSIFAPLRFLRAVKPEDEVAAAYMECAKLFYSQMAKASAIRNLGTLFTDFLLLPPLGATTQTKHQAFKDRLTAAVFEDGRIFSDDAVSVLMGRAGHFVYEAAGWGIFNINAFLPDVRESPEVQAAATQKQEAEDKAAAIKVAVDAVNLRAQEIKAGADVSSDLAFVGAMKMSGQDVDIKHKNFTFSGHGVADAAHAFADAAQIFRQFNGGSNNQPSGNPQGRRRNHGNNQPRGKSTSGTGIAKP